MDLTDYYDHDERELNCMIHSNGPKRSYMADPHDCGNNIDQQRYVKNTCVPSDNENDYGLRGGSKDGLDQRQDGDKGEEDERPENPERVCFNQKAMAIQQY